MNIQQLKHLLAVAKHENLLHAAHELNISQSGISRSISGLESTLGVNLFIRRARGVKLTDAGRDFLRRAQAIVNEFQRATEEVSAIKDARTGKVVIGINHSFAHYITQGVIADALKDAPKLEIDVATNNYYQLIDNLLANRFDFGISVYFESEKHPELVYEELFPFESMAFAAPNHRLAKARRVTAKDLGECRWALLEGRAARSSFEAYFRTHEIALPTIALQVASLALLAAVVSRLDLVTLLPRQAALVKFNEGKTLQMLRIEKPMGTAQCGLIYRADSVQTPAVDQIKRLFKVHAARYQEKVP